MEEALFVLQIENKGNVQTVDLTESMTIGRNAKNSHADIGVEGNYISRKHGRFDPGEMSCCYTDLGSLNGTWLNGRRIDPEVPVELRNGDVLQICAGAPDSCEEYTTIYFLVPGYTMKAAHDPLEIAARMKTEEPYPEPAADLADEPVLDNVRSTAVSAGDSLCIDIHKRSVSSFGKKKTLLRDISLEIPSGSMVLILGGSGAGKTTFMNAVMGYEKADAEITYGDNDIYEDFEEMKYEIGYVPQQDLMRGSDSVYETLRNAAELKLPVRMSSSKREARIEYVLDMLGLSRETETAVSRLSGGQRKRLSIALEYVSDPSLFFLDEPDSGLDGIMSRSLMNSLRSIADEGKIILVISHAPDRVRELFDGIIVLAKSSEDCGRLAFYGTPEEAERFFGVSSLEEIVAKINRPDEGGEGKADYFIEKFEKMRS